MRNNRSGLLISFFVLLAMVLFYAPQTRAATSCGGNNHCSGGFSRIGGNGGVGPITRKYCGQNGQACCTCATTKTNLQRYMDIHRKGGSGQPSFLFKTYWEDTVNPGLQALLTKIHERIVAQRAALGGFATGQENIRSMSALQEGSAEAARNYMTSEALCRFGSLSQSLGADDVKRIAAQETMTTQGLKRSLGTRGSIAQSGRASDLKIRANQWVMEYCNPNREGQDVMCGQNSQRRFPNLPKDTRYDLDVNYTRAIEDKSTLDADVINPTSDTRPTEQDINAMAANLYGSKQLSSRFTKKSLTDVKTQKAFMQTRSIAASRAVAQNTFSALAAMKSRGSGSSQQYMNALLMELGVSKNAADAELTDQPSYYAQMDILTKKLYQDPVFYVNLMEGKTNVARQSGAMEGIELMQDRDIYQSMRRSEMLLALLIQLQSHKLLDDAAEDVKTNDSNAP